MPLNRCECADAAYKQHEHGRAINADPPDRAVVSFEQPDEKKTGKQCGKTGGCNLERSSCIEQGSVAIG